MLKCYEMWTCSWTWTYPKRQTIKVVKLSWRWSCIILLRCAGRAHGMDGAHKRQRRTSDLVVGDEGEAGAKRQRVQNGVAAAGRKGQATQIRAASLGTVPVEVRTEVAKAMQVGSALVQASLEHLQTAERSWDKWVANACA